MHKIILVGLPGSGKTSAGRQIARRFFLPFVDSDHAIEEKIGMPIKEYFSLHGEAAFRDMETATLHEIALRPEPCVLSTGGGAVLRAENRALLRQAGTVVYLRVHPKAIYRRLRHDTQRPLLQVDDPQAKINTLYAERDGLYREAAHHVMAAGTTSVSSLVRKIVLLLQAAGDLPQEARRPLQK